MTQNLEEAKPPRIGIAVLIYVVALLGAIYVAKAYRPQGPALAVTIVVPVIALIWAIQRSIAQRRALGPATIAQRAYFKRFMLFMAAYGLLLFAAIWANQAIAPQGALAVVLAIVPALPLIGVIYAMARLIADETDEYQRNQTVAQFLVATGFTLVLCTIWGFLEQFGLVMHLPAYWAFIVWCAGLGVGSVWNEVRS